MFARKAEGLKAAIARFERRLEEPGRLWQRQSEAMAAVGDFLSGSLEAIEHGETASGAIIMPTGTGKTRIAAEICDRLDVRAMILSPTLPIAAQHFIELRKIMGDGFDASLYCGGHQDLSGKVIVSTYQSAVKLFKEGGLPEDVSILFFDEAHNSISPERTRLHGNVALLEIGLTATPSFDERRHIWQAFDSPIYEMSLQEGIEEGILSPLRGFVIETKVDASFAKLRKKGGQTDEREAERFLNVLARNLVAVKTYKERFRGVPAVAFCITQRHAEDLAELFIKSGVNAAAVHSGMGTGERERTLDAFARGELDVITNCGVLFQGWDSERVVLGMNLRPTYSRVVKTHTIGRVLRMREGKEAGIFVEFQDYYGSGQQPLLMHHIFGAQTYRDGGLVAAPRKKMEEEGKRLKKGESVAVLKDLDVSFNLRTVIKLDEGNVDLRDRGLLKDILEEHGGVGLYDLGTTDFFKTGIFHPAFTGTVLTLMHKVFGVRHGRGSVMNRAEDRDMFMWYVYEDEILERTQGPLSVYDMPALTYRSVEPLRPLALMDGLSFGFPEDIVETREEARKISQRIELDDREIQILQSRIGPDEETCSQLGSLMGVTHTRIRQIEQRALRKMRYSAFLISEKERRILPPGFDVEEFNIFCDPRIPNCRRGEALGAVLIGISPGMYSTFNMVPEGSVRWLTGDLRRSGIPFSKEIIKRATNIWIAEMERRKAERESSGS